MRDKYTKNCPICDEIMIYSRENSLDLSIKENRKCRKCCNKKNYTSEEKNNRVKMYRQKPEIKQKIREYNKKYKQKLNVKEKSKKYRLLPETKEKRRKKQKEKLKDPIMRLNHNISISIYISLKSKNLSKAGRHWEDLVGYTLQQLKEHLEKQFQSGMSWDNKGRNGWHIDHRIPINFFRYTSTEDVEFKYCWSLNNLQPLWEEENLSKKDKLIPKYYP